MKISTNYETNYERDAVLGQAIANNRDALNEIFARHRGQLYSRALLLLGNPEDAEDALQEGLLSAFRNLREFKGRSKFSTWLTRIVVNAALMQLRRRRSRVTVSMDDKLKEDGQDWAVRFPDPRPNPEEACARRERLQIIQRGVQDLGARYGSALWLRDIQGLTTREAAEALGLAEGTLKSQLSRARLKLKKGIITSPVQTLLRKNRRTCPVREHHPNSQWPEGVVLPAA